MQLGRRLLEDMKGEHKEKVGNDENTIKLMTKVGDNDKDDDNDDDYDDGNNGDDDNDNYESVDKDNGLIKVETDKLMDKNFKKEFPGLGFHQVAALLVGEIHSSSLTPMYV